MCKENIRTETRYLGPAPSILVYQDSAEKAAQKGTILLYHGLFFHKEGHMRELESLASMGYLAVGIDAPGHGARLNQDLKQSLSDKLTQEQGYNNLVLQAAKEVTEIIDALLQDSLAEDVKIAMVGISFGAFITYAALMHEKRIVAAVPLLGSPEWNSPQSPHLHSELFYPAAILSQTAGLDLNVPPKAARNFHDALRQHYNDTPERLRYIEYRYSSHFMREDDWSTAWEQTLEWLKKFL